MQNITERLLHWTTCKDPLQSQFHAKAYKRPENQKKKKFSTHDFINVTFMYCLLKNCPPLGRKTL